MPRNHLVKTPLRGGKRLGSKLIASRFIATLGLVIVLLTASGWAKEKILWDFINFPEGANPMSALVADSAGTLYGTTSQGGRYGHGSVFALPSPLSASYPTGGA